MKPTKEEIKIRAIWEAIEEKKQNVIESAADPKPERTKGDTDKEYEAKLKRWERTQEQFREFQPTNAPTLDDAYALLDAYYRRPQKNEKTGKLEKGSIWENGTRKSNLIKKRAVLRKLYKE